LWQHSRVVVILLKSIVHKDLSLFFRGDLKYNKVGYHQLIPVYYGIGQVQDLRTQQVLQRQNTAFSFSNKAQNNGISFQCVSFKVFGQMQEKTLQP
jgi:hypothetical protein